MLRLVFMNMVCNTLLSELESEVFSSAQLDGLEACGEQGCDWTDGSSVTNLAMQLEV